jgi:hypothetical protein
MAMTTVAVTPVLGEFGYVVFDVQPRVRHWLAHQDAAEKIVIAPRSLAWLFDEATDVIEPPAELLPSAPASRGAIRQPSICPSATPSAKRSQ